jgi:predicted metal-dependent phosphoesterase TrpH
MPGIGLTFLLLVFGIFILLALNLWNGHRVRRLLDRIESREARLRQKLDAARLDLETLRKMREADAAAYAAQLTAIANLAKHGLSAEPEYHGPAYLEVEYLRRGFNHLWKAKKARES